jgi:hypothetical protein
VATSYQFRRGTSTYWGTVNPILADGEITISDGTSIKIGDGIHAWNELPYYAPDVGTIEETEFRRFVTDIEKAYWNNKAENVLVTDLVNGLMRSIDKVKLDTVESNANNYTHPVNHPPSIITQDSSNRFFTDAERSKLGNIEANANNYTHPANHLPSIITQDSANRFFTDAERNKLTGIESGANQYVHPASHNPSIITQDLNNRFVTDSQVNSWNDKENNLGTPPIDGYMLRSLTDGTREWVAPGGYVLPQATDVLLGGVYTGANGVPIKNGDNTLQEDEYRFNVLDDVPSPSLPGILKIYARNRSGRSLPGFIGKNGLDTSFQPAFFGNSVTMWFPGYTTAASIAMGCRWTIDTTQSHPTITNTSLLQSMKRAQYRGNGSSAGVRCTTPTNWRGNQPGLGGFFFSSRFGMDSYVSNMRMFIGLTSTTSSMTSEPSAYANTVGISKDSTDTTLQLLFRNNITAYKFNTGYTPATNDVFDLFLFCPPNSDTITCRLTKLNDGTIIVDNQEFNTNLPLNNTMLCPQAMVYGTGLLSLMRIYIESDL